MAETATWRRTQGGDIPGAPYAVQLDFYLARPKRATHPWPSSRDVDKLERAVLDGLVRGGLLSDDRHVVELRSTKRWAATPDGECCQVTIARAQPGELAA